MTDIEYLERLGREYLRNEAEIERLKQMNDGIKATFAGAVANGEIQSKATIGSITSSVRPGNARIDARKLEADYPAEQFPQLYKLAVDTAAVKAAIAANDLEAYQTRGADVVKIDVSK